MSTDEDVIRSVVARLPHTLDTKHWADLRALFVDEVETDYTSLFGGRPTRQTADELIAGWKKMLGDVATQHLLGPLLVSLAEGAATVECHVHASHQARGSDWVVLGHYLIELRQVGTEWRIFRLTLETFLERGERKVVQPDAA